MSECLLRAAGCCWVWEVECSAATNDYFFSYYLEYVPKKTAKIVENNSLVYKARHVSRRNVSVMVQSQIYLDTQINLANKA